MTYIKHFIIESHSQCVDKIARLKKINLKGVNMIKKNILWLSMLSATLLFSGCDATNTEKKSENVPTVERNIPMRNEVVKEENVVSNRNITLSGEKLFLNSRFVRSIIPTSRFPSLSRSSDQSDDIYANNELIDAIISDMYDKATDEEKEYFAENIEDLQVCFEMVTEYDTTDDTAKKLIAQERSYNENLDEIYNGFGIEEVALESSRSNSDEINVKKYRKVNQRSRYVSPDEKIVKAADLATYFFLSGDVEELENITKMFDADINMRKLKNSEVLKANRSVSINDSFVTERKGALDFFKNKAKQGDIVSRELSAAAAVLYGRYDHAGMFNRDKFRTEGENKTSKCILSSYPSFGKPGVTEKKHPTGWRAPERLDYVSYEPLANFIDGKTVTVNRAGSEYQAKRAFEIAWAHFYGDDGKKSDYDPWCTGKYNGVAYTCISEYLKLTNSSTYNIEKTNYCSYVGWYGYKKAAGIDLDADITYLFGLASLPVKNVNGGNMKVPTDIVNSAYNKKALVWTKIKGKNSCGTYYYWGYVSKDVYFKKSSIVFSSSEAK